MFEGRIAVITGGGSGMGRATARLLASQGAIVHCADINGDAALQSAQDIRATGGQAHGHRLDVTDAAGCAALAAEVAAQSGDAAVLVNCAGMTLRTNLDDPEVLGWWHRTMETNATGAYNMVVAFAPQLRRTEGSIVNIASITAFVGAGIPAAYCASKGAIVAMTRALASELAPAGVRVNAIAPGLIDTPMASRTIDDEAALRRTMARTPLRRPGQPEDVAEAVAFLASDRARYITGVVLPVDGGMLAA